MELEYGRPVEEVFVDITPEPLAAASLGQVRFLFMILCVVVIDICTAVNFFALFCADSRAVCLRHCVCFWCC